MLQNSETSPVALLNSVSITDAHPTISKILGTLTGNNCSGVSFGMVIEGGVRGLHSAALWAKKLQNLRSPACKLINSAAAAFI